MARAVMLLATGCLGNHRRAWACAMQAEFETALRDGKALSFSTGCLMAAWCEMPTHVEGRLLLARHALALGLIVPVAALLLSGALFGVAYPDFQHADIFKLLLRSEEHVHFLHDGNRAAAPVLTQLMAAIGAMRLAVAWGILDGNWTRVAALERLGAASTITLVVFTTIANLDATRMILPVAVLVFEWIAVSTLAWLHGETQRPCLC